MRRVIGIGETVLDIVFKDDKPIGAIPGGSVLNAMVSLGRCGVDSTFISEVGNDRVGKMTVSFLKDNGINTDHISMPAGNKSSVSLAFLDENNDAHYLFYKNKSGDRFDVASPQIRRDDIVLVGSFYAVDPDTRRQVFALLEQAREAGAIIYYDVNFRAAHRNDVIKIKPNLIENLEFADIVRGSSEDFEVLYNMSDAEKVYRSELSFHCRKFIFTNGSKPARLFTESDDSKEYAVDAVPAVSTIGAGDNFNAGLIYGLIKNGIGRDDIDNGLKPEQWDSIIATAQMFAAECCKDISNSVSVEFGKEMKL